MSGARGQALRWGHRLGTALLATLLLALGALALFAWQLSRHPVELPQLARAIARATSGDGLSVSIGGAALAWQGFHRGMGAPLDIHLRDIRVTAGADGSQLDLPGAEIGLSVGALLRGTLAPRSITLNRPRLHAVLGPDGSLALGPESGDPDAGLDPRIVLQALMRPAHDGEAHTALRRVVIAGGEAVLHDGATGRSWALLEPQIELLRRAEGGIAAAGTAIFRSGAVSVPVQLAGSATGDPMVLSGRMLLPELQPRQIASIWPGLAPLGVVDAPVRLSAGAEFDAALKPVRVTATLAGGAGSLALAGQGRLRIAGFEAELEGSGRHFMLREARLRLPGIDGRPGPVLAGRVELQPGAAGGWQGEAHASLEPVALAELPRLWPADLAPAVRARVLQAVVGGTLGQATLRLGVSLPETLDGIRLGDSRFTFGTRDLVIEPVKGARLRAATTELAVRFGEDRVQVERLAIRLPPPAVSGGPAPLIEAQASAERRGARWQLRAGAKLDRLNALDMTGYWPPGIVNGHTRDWIIENVTAGILRNGQWQVAASLPAGLDDIEVTSVTGSAEFVDGTVHWLRPIPPIAGMSGSAEFGLKEITLRGRGGRQLGPDGKPSGLEIREGLARFHGLETEPGQAEIRGSMVGPLVDAVALLKHPRLQLFEKRPLPLNPAGGRIDASLTVAFPLWNDLKVEQLAVRGTGKVIDGKLLRALLDHDLERANVDLTVDTDTLKASAQAQYLGSPVRLTTELDFRSGPPTQVIERATLSGRFNPAQVKAMGFDTFDVMTGTLALDARAENRRNGSGTVQVRADLRESRLGIDGFAWSKPAGTPATSEATLRLQGETLAAIESFRVDGPELALRGSASFGARSRLERVVLAGSSLAGSRFNGTFGAPARDGGEWRVALRGQLLDLGPAFEAENAARAAGQSRRESTNPPAALDIRFDQVVLGERRALHGVQGTLRLDGVGVLREAALTGRSHAAEGQSGFDLRVTPEGARRHLRLNAADGGALLRAFDIARVIEGGRLAVNASYAETRPGAPLMGIAELDGFLLHDAPAAAKLLQVLSVYGIAEAVRSGRGLNFNKAVVPFTLTPEVLTLADARAFSASLGVTAKGQVWREREQLELEGTIVPSYMFNSLLGHIPILGRLFSPEAGGGLIAATWRLQGPMADPAASVNPLAALTPGALRGLFGLGGNAPR